VSGSRTPTTPAGATGQGLRQAPGHFLRGMAMGSADIVPGVSGGTVALVLAIYHRLVAAIRNGSAALGHFLKADVRGGWALLRQVEWAFLIPLVLGILTAVLLLAGTIEHQLEAHPVQMSGLFLGLVAGSTVVATGLLTRRDAREWALILLAGAAFFVALGFTAGSSEADAGGEVALWQYFAAGAIAICAMILPGVSGSFLLVTMGMYAPVLSAVNARDLPTLAVFALGCVVGLALFSQFLHWALTEHYDVTLAILIGLMLGSLRVLWPWPDGADSVVIGAPDEAVGPTVALMLGGLALVLVVDRIAHRVERRTSRDEAEELHAG
jgi:putative membrane protein